MKLHKEKINKKGIFFQNSMVNWGENFDIKEKKRRGNSVKVEMQCIK